MYSYTPTQIFTIHPHEHQQVMYAHQQQQTANLLFHQYNQLHPMQTTYPSPTVTPVTYAQQPIDQQLYRSDQMGAQSTPSQRPSPVNIIPIPSPHAVSRPMLDVMQYNSRSSSTNRNPSPVDLSHIFQPLQPSEKYRRRERLHSGSSCYGTDSEDLFSNSEEEYEWRPTHVKSSSIQKRSNSTSPLELESGDIHQHSTKTKNYRSRPKIIRYIEENIIGKNYVYEGPWGSRRMIYCDHTASGRPLAFIENYIKNVVLPIYGNTHSESSFCAQQSTKFREEARDIIKNSVNANDKDVLIFTGTGVTGAVHTLVSALDLHNVKIRKNTVVLIGAFEHHSNILPWKETGVESIRIPTTNHGLLDKTFLKEKLEFYSKLKRRIICSLSAASNITGILTDTDSISTLVHSYSGLIFWDYATAAPYVKIDMNSSATAYKDAIFISTHKLLGGPGAPGILIAKKNVFKSNISTTCGGGTVNFVTRTNHEYTCDIETREEGGTPDIIGCIRAGLVFQLKESLDLNYIKSRDEELVKRFYQRFKNLQSLIVLGSQTASRLPIFSFTVYIPSIGKYLHHHLVCRLFTDLFGIQARSGCACAGPYAMDLLNVSDAKADDYCLFLTEDACFRGNEKVVRTLLMKPGFTRLNLPYYATDDEIEYIFNAIEFIAVHGWKFLPYYTYNPTTGLWSHRNGFQLAPASLQDITYKSNRMQYYGKPVNSVLTGGNKNLQDPLREAKLLAANALKHALETTDYKSDPPLNVPDKYQHLIWFALPIDTSLITNKQKESDKEIDRDVHSIPFIPDDAKTKIISSLKTKSVTNGRSQKTRTSTRGR